jgi:hypothetical protein
MAFQAYFIDARAREVRPVEISDYREINTWLGCSCFTIAYCDEASADALYVDDEGLLKTQEHWFFFEGRDDQPFPGNGVWLGPEDIDADGAEVQRPPVASIDELRAMIRFAGPPEIRAWVAEQRARDAEPDGVAVDIVTGGLPYAFSALAETG